MPKKAICLYQKKYGTETPEYKKECNKYDKMWKGKRMKKIAAVWLLY